MTVTRQRKGRPGQGKYGQTLKKMRLHVYGTLTLA
jgi:hypothetical protein